MAAVLILNDDRSSGTYVEKRKVWRVPQSPRFPDGVKFAFTLFTRTGSRTGRIYGVVNHRGVGVHEHVGSNRFPIATTDWSEALQYFNRRVQEILG